ncbi:MAG: hypothetical protein GX594_06535 [Pirellulaceae bacterium]|nr:hypothetical protein [Pirellulaceae bacterium]
MNCPKNLNACECGSAEGERLKVDALTLLEARREVYVRRGRRAMLQTMLNGNGTATADDVRAAVELPPGMDPRCFGSVPGPLARAEIIRRAGFAKSARRERHASYILLWELADTDKAIRWLREHPELLAPDEREGAAVERQYVLFDQENTTPTAGTVGAG